MTEQMSDREALEKIGEENKSAGALVGALLIASARSATHTMDTLYEVEREHRQALEVLIEDVLDNLDRAHMGSAREYEAAVAPLRWGVHGNLAGYAARHRNHDPR